MFLCWFSNSYFVKFGETPHLMYIHMHVHVHMYLVLCWHTFIYSYAVYLQALYGNHIFWTNFMQQVLSTYICMIDTCSQYQIEIEIEITGVHISASYCRVYSERTERQQLLQLMCLNCFSWSNASYSRTPMLKTITKNKHTTATHAHIDTQTNTHTHILMRRHRHKCTQPQVTICSTFSHFSSSALAACSHNTKLWEGGQIEDGHARSLAEFALATISVVTYEFVRINTYMHM